jgi:trehalose 6-phosphate synthase/phosphatase
MSADTSEGGVSVDLDFILAVSGDEKLLRWLNEFDNAETCSTSEQGTDAKWKLDPTQATDTLVRFANVS